MKVLDDTLISNELPIDDTDYEFSINTDIPGFSVTRKSNREVRFLKIMFIVSKITFVLIIQVLFSSIGVGGFIYANQFLQISSFIPVTYEI